MQKRLLTTLLLLLGYLLPAQTLEWDKAIPSINSQTCYTMDTVENNYWLAGSFSNTREHMLLYAINSNGDTLWHKNYLPNINLSSINKILPAPAGKYIIGIYDDDTIPQQAHNLTPVIFYVDYSGEIIWEQHNLIPECASFNIQDVQLMANGDIVIVGMYSRLYDYCVAPPYTAAAMRISPQGDKIWEQHYPQSYIYSIEKLQELPNNQLLYSGYSWNNNINFTFLMRTDGSNGNVLQSKYVYPTTSPATASMRYGEARAFSDGSYMVSGWYMYNNVPYGYLYKLDHQMNTVWSKKIKEVSHFRIAEMLDRTMLLHTTNTRGLLNVKKYSAQGDSLWKVTFGETLTFSETNTPMSGIKYDVHDACFRGTSYVFAGTKLNYNAYTGGDFYIAKINDVGLPINNFCQHPPQASFDAILSNDTLKLNSNSYSNIFYHPALNYAWYAGSTYIGSDSLLSYQVTAANYPNGLPIKLVITNHWGCKDSTQAILHPDGTITGNKPNSNRQSTTISNIYPNPAAQSVRLDYSVPTTCKEANLKIYELGTGRTLLQKRLSVLERSTRVEVSSLPQGLYGCQLYADGIPAPNVQKLSVVR